jgi:starch-binding outer membrane protein, SusD/RagB family
MNNIMKNINKKIPSLIILVFVLVFSNSCEDKLDPVIHSQLTSANFPKTGSDVNMLLTTLYSQFSHDWGTDRGAYATMGSWRHLGTAASDECVDKWYPVYTLRWGSAYDTFDRLYHKVKYVAQATTLLEVIRTADMSEAAKKDAIAETKVLRAWLMFMLYDFYGPVNVRLDPNKLGDLTYESRPTKEAYLAAMIKDLEEAIPDLAEKTNNTPKWGRVNKGVARMLLMKIYMNDAQWAKAKAVGESLFSMGYTLQPSYKDVFLQIQNNEVIYGIPAGPAVQNHWMMTIMPSNAGTVLGLTAKRGWYGYYMPWQFYDKYPANDARLETIADSYVTTQGTVVTRASLEGAIPMKYLHPLTVTDNGQFGTVVFRHADVLLSMAEIENKIGNMPIQEIVQNYVKPVTDRANITIPSEAVSSRETLNSFLLDERGRELYWEGFRRMDMIRFGKLITWANSVGIPATSNMVLYPIPPKVIIESGGIIQNNPGY